MKVHVPKSEQEHFWKEPPAGTMEFWAFRFMPKCSIGELIMFFFDDTKVVAEAIVAKIEAPGLSHCDSTGRFQHRWKVFWRQDTFKDLRD